MAKKANKRKSMTDDELLAAAKKKAGGDPTATAWLRGEQGHVHRSELEEYLETGAVPRHEIASNKRRYPVGQRHLYVYHLMQGGTIADARKYVERYNLTPEEVAGLDKLLRDLAGRREAKERKPARQPDPYWSLWGKLKARHERDMETQERHREVEEEIGGGFLLHAADAALDGYYRYERETLLLPRRRVEVDYDGECLVVAGRSKAVKNDAHAVNALRKLDTDDGYFARLMAE